MNTIEKIKRKLRVGAYTFTTTFIALSGVGCSKDESKGASNNKTFVVSLNPDSIQKSDIFDSNNNPKSVGVELILENKSAGSLSASKITLTQDDALQKGVKVTCSSENITKRVTDLSKCGLSDIAKGDKKRVNLTIEGVNHGEKHDGKIQFSVTCDNETESVELEIRS